MFSANSEVLLKIETLEQNFASLSEQNETLLVDLEDKTVTVKMNIFLPFLF